MKMLKLTLFNLSLALTIYGMEKFLEPKRNTPQTNQNTIFAFANTHTAPLNKTLSVLTAREKIEEKNHETSPKPEEPRFSQKILVFLIDKIFSKPKVPYKNFLRDQLHSINDMTSLIYKISNQISNKEEEGYALWEMYSIPRDIITVTSKPGVVVDENKTDEEDLEGSEKLEIQLKTDQNPLSNNNNNIRKRRSSHP